MIRFSRYVALTATGFASTLAGAAQAQQAPTGTWIDHTGRGAVEITECGAALCGRVVWVKDRGHSDTCGTQIIGNVKRTSGGTWDGGWIYDPDAKSKYSVELKPVGGDKLRVVGYLGSKLFSETMTWKRPTTELERCDGVNTTAVQPEKKADAPAAVAPAAPAKTAAAAPSPLPIPALPPDTAPLQAAPASAMTPLASSSVKSSEPKTKSKVETVADSDEPPASGKGKGAKSNCKVKIPYIGITVSCKDLPEEFRSAAGKFGG